MIHLLAYLLTTLIFFAIDFVWLGFIAKPLYNDLIGPLLKQPFDIPVAVGFYLIYVVGIVIFAIAPQLGPNGDWKQVALYGALFGFFCYATYDLTNLAVMKGYPYSMAAIDMAWGTVLTGTSATLGYLATKLIYA